MKCKQPNTTGYRAMRERFGLSQRELAAQLGISRSAIALAETGRRMLPTLAMLKMAQLEAKMAGLQLTGAAAMEEALKSATSPPRQSSIIIREIEDKLRMHKLLYAIQSKTERYKTLQARLRLLDAVLADEPDQPVDPFIKGMQFQRERIRQQMEKCNPEKQQTLYEQMVQLQEVHSGLVGKAAAEDLEANEAEL